jgi:hypothetical protein
MAFILMSSATFAGPIGNAAARAGKMAGSQDGYLTSMLFVLIGAGHLWRVVIGGPSRLRRRSYRCS